MLVYTATVSQGKKALDTSYEKQHSIRVFLSSKSSSKFAPDPFMRGRKEQASYRYEGLYKIEEKEEKEQHKEEGKKDFGVYYLRYTNDEETTAPTTTATTQGNVTPNVNTIEVSDDENEADDVDDESKEGHDAPTTTTSTKPVPIGATTGHGTIIDSTGRRTSTRLRSKPAWIEDEMGATLLTEEEKAYHEAMCANDEFANGENGISPWKNYLYSNCSFLHGSTSNNNFLVF